MTHKIRKGIVEVEGTTYRAFENSFNHTWYVVQGTKASDMIVAKNIVAQSANKALAQWLADITQPTN